MRATCSPPRTSKAGSPAGASSCTNGPAHLRRVLSAARFEGRERWTVSENDEPGELGCNCGGRDLQRHARAGSSPPGRRRSTLHGQTRPRRASIGSEAIAQLIEAAGEARRDLAVAADVEREIGARALEWTRSNAELLALADVEAARELGALRARRRALARRRRGRLRRRAEAGGIYLEEAGRRADRAPRRGRPASSSARWRTAGSCFVHSTRARGRAPRIQRSGGAHDYLVERALERALEARVRWA